MFDFTILQYTTLSLSLVVLTAFLYVTYGAILRDFMEPQGRPQRITDGVVLVTAYIPMLVAAGLTCDMMYRIMTQNLGGM